MRLAFIASIVSVYAQSNCPDVQFKTAVSASLTPSLTTQLALLRQADGSYTSFETTNKPPYSKVSVSPHFERQLDSCLPAKTPAVNPAPLAPANPVGMPSQPFAVAQLSSGFFLTAGAIFDSQMNLVSLTNGIVGGATYALADVNGDGNLDLISASNGTERSGGQLSIQLGNGGVSFQSPVTYPIGSFLVQLSSFAIGDLNGDRKLDIAIVVSPFGGPGSIMTFLGNGDGTFRMGPTASLNYSLGSIALADLNGDGKLDFVVSGGSGIALAFGNGDGSFATPSYTPTSGSSIAIGDMNGDGIPDIVTGGTILFGDGKGAFPTRQDYNLSPSILTNGSVILTDMDGDGRMDIVIAEGTPGFITGPTITVLFQQPDGTFFAPLISIATGLTAAGNFNTDLRTGDFNGDGIPDVAYGGSSGVGVMLGKGDGTFVSSSSESMQGVPYLATGDFNGDGNLDLAVLVTYPPEAQALNIFLGKGDGTFQVPLAMPLQNVPTALAAGDFNGDGKVDIAVLFTTENNGAIDEVVIYLGNGDGSFRQGASYPTGPRASWILAGDLNNDGKPDLIVSNSGWTTIGSISTFMGKGDGTFITGTTVPLAASLAGDNGPNTMALADFNRDGKLDLAVSLMAPNTTAEGFAILLGKGDGTFGTPIISSLKAESIVAGDLNGDGIPDLFVYTQGGAYYQPEGPAYLLGNGDGSFQPPVYLPTLTGSALVIADANRDGKPDLLSTPSSAQPGVVSVLNLTTASSALKIVSSATFAEAPVASGSFVSLFGASLPTSGVSITVTDSDGISRPATPSYPSATQMNFVMPVGMSMGSATVDMSSGTMSPLVAKADIVPLAPGLFAVNNAGLAAAYAIRVDAQGNQSIESVFTVQNGAIVATPINLGAATDQVYLILFGTGFDGAIAQNTFVTVGGVLAPTAFSGPQGTPGLDQVNVLLPHSLAGSGDSIVMLYVGGTFANAVHITIQ